MRLKRKGVKAVMRIFFRTLILSMVAASVWVPLASAHVVVTPKQAGIAEETIFSIGVPNEKDISMTELSLDIPDGVQQVSPTVQAGWTITTTKSSDGDNRVTRIIWQGGEIPAGQRGDFTFQPWRL
jgi:uncharacterized protein YcnI